ncbi:unnamed protein product [marine sediment metagenome]|uniref:Lcl C-terminal domain-containing protein n=1 Tax=marine sediment metagenome TaxID=412755 RepID=X1JAP5_9ZZZZ
MEFNKHIFSRGLPKTGQETEYVAGDDGTYQAGWWLRRTIANNRTRFIVKTIGGDVVVFDRATGLCWAGDGNEVGCNNGATITWPNALTYALALDFAGFKDWRVPNLIELLSICNYAVTSPAIKEPPFANTVEDFYFTSTTYIVATAKVWAISFDIGMTGQIAKSILRYLRCVRNGV